MNKIFLYLICLGNLGLGLYTLYRLNNSPSTEQNVKVRIAQSDRFLAENANNITLMKSENEALKERIQALEVAINAQGELLRTHSALIKNRR